MPRHRNLKYALILALFLASVVVLFYYAFKGTPESEAAFTTCANETSVTEGPSNFSWRVLGDRRTVRVKGTVRGSFVGTCRGFATVKARVERKRPGHRYRRVGSVQTFLNLEFKNGLNDTGQPAHLSFERILSSKFKCRQRVRVVATIGWRYQNNELVSPSTRIVAGQRRQRCRIPRR